MVAQPIVVVLKLEIGFLPYKAEHIHGRNEPSFSVGRATYIDATGMDVLLPECREVIAVTDIAFTIVTHSVYSFYDLFLDMLAPKVDYMLCMVLVYSDIFSSFRPLF